MLEVSWGGGKGRRGGKVCLVKRDALQDSSISTMAVNESRTHARNNLRMQRILNKTIAQSEESRLLTGEQTAKASDKYEGPM